jgi:uncharacterized protein
LLGEALHTELAQHKVTLTVLSPGMTDTGFFQAAGDHPEGSRLRMMMGVRPVVDIGLAALHRKRSSIVPGTVNKLIAFSSRILSRQFSSRTSYKMLKNEALIIRSK